MSDTRLPHATSAPEDIRKEAGAVLDAARAAAPADRLGRVDWMAISKKMAVWWREKGYDYP